MNGVRYFKGSPVPCTFCEKGKLLGVKNKETNAINNALLEWGETIEGVATLEVSNQQETVVDLTTEELLKIPDIYRGLTYSRQAVNKVIGSGSNPLFDKLDEMLLQLKQGELQKGNYFLAAPQSMDVLLWAYTMLTTAYEQGFSVVPVSALDVLYAVYMKDKEKKLSTEQSEMIVENGLGITWLDCMFAELLVLTLPATFSNRDLSFLMTLIDARNSLNHCTCVVSYWASKFVSWREGGSFIFKQGNRGISLFDVFEYFPTKANNTTTKKYRNVVPR